MRSTRPTEIWQPPGPMAGLRLEHQDGPDTCLWFALRGCLREPGLSIRQLAEAGGTAGGTANVGAVRRALANLEQKRGAGNVPVLKAGSLRGGFHGHLNVTK